MTKGTSVCIVSMNKASVLAQTLSSVFQHTKDPFEVIVVDNGSTDQAVFDLYKKYEGKIKLILNDENKGLSVATNQGLEAGQYDTLVHMDDDCLLRTDGWNLKMQNLLARDSIGMVTPGVYGIAIEHDGYQEITWGLGMCWGIKRSLFEDIGGYDPQLYHQNECDMALRVRMAGYVVAATREIGVTHNDPGGPKSAIASARERIGVVQFRDKWTSYFRSRDWNYGTDPLYLMQHWPPDQEFYRRFALQNGVQLNPAPDYMPTDHEREAWERLDHLSMEQKINIKGTNFLIYRDLRNDYCHWEWQLNPNAYIRDRDQIIQDWFDVTGEKYTKYAWPHNLLRPY